MRIGPTKAPAKAPRVPFTFAYLRDDEVEEQEFRVIQKSPDMGTLNRLAGLADQDEATMMSKLPVITRALAKMLDNSDGVKAGWKPTPLPAKDDDEESQAPRFRGPDGEIYEWEYAESFLAVDQGSSRRRFLHLMLEDDEAEVDSSDINQLTKFVMETASGRPTPASS